MQRAIDETNRHREKQIAYNTEHNIIPKTVIKSKEQVFAQTSVLDIKGFDEHKAIAVDYDEDIIEPRMVAENEVEYEAVRTIPQLEKAIAQTKKRMEKAAKDMDFMEAAKLRDEMFALQKELKGMK